jgi:hypothetical protein
MITVHRTANDYEILRAAVLGAELVRGPALMKLRRNGLTSWLKSPIPEPIAPTLCAGQARSSAANGDPSLMTTELTRLIAGIVVALAAEPAPHA